MAQQSNVQVLDKKTTSLLVQIFFSWMEAPSCGERSVKPKAMSFTKTKDYRAPQGTRCGTQALSIVGTWNTHGRHFSKWMFCFPLIWMVIVCTDLHWSTVVSKELLAEMASSGISHFSPSTASCALRRSTIFAKTRSVEQVGTTNSPFETLTFTPKELAVWKF